MAIIRNLTNGRVRSTKRFLPTSFSSDGKTKIQHRLIGDNHIPSVCDPSVCHGAIKCDEGTGCWFTVACDTPVVTAMAMQLTSNLVVSSIPVENTSTFTGIGSGSI